MLPRSRELPLAASRLKTVLTSSHCPLVLFCANQNATAAAAAKEGRDSSAWLASHRIAGRCRAESFGQSPDVNLSAIGLHLIDANM